VANGSEHLNSTVDHIGDHIESDGPFGASMESKDLLSRRRRCTALRCPPSLEEQENEATLV
jgi:hypothetical protein